ncbi:DEAD/DEAH box helicase [uncultured Paraglaciecola sp.]|uniref:DEAD/DEAH box helicase n=1 Tax=uncultured Paraglaciecola sp. TaxID=1765024 RepID=UPI002639320C|nr:DEAD/DEAH box helicase [uncultured Paraglaciecola sp.]
MNSTRTEIGNYADYLKTREPIHESSGLKPLIDTGALFDFQIPIVNWALQRGRAAIFADTGLGKSAMQIHWAKGVHDQAGGCVLLLAPLAVSAQTIREGEKFGIAISKADPSDVDPAGLVITNYEQLQNFDPALFSGIVLDESSIIKGLNGKVRAQIQSFAVDLPYRLSCTATPAPNDFMEIGTQCEFLGVMKQMEMLAMYFTHDSAKTSKWRLKGHAKERFFEWMASWSVILKNPADIGFNGDAYNLPPVVHHEHVVGELTLSDKEMQSAGLLIRGQIRKGSLKDRCEKAAAIANAMEGQVIIWCNLNDESALLTELINDAVEVKGSDKPVHKEKSLLCFQDGSIRALVTKPKLAGFGMNFQSCSQMVFTGLSDSWEQYYQAIRRVWRFGQTQEVHIHVVSHANEGMVIDNIKRKDDDNNALSTQMRNRASEIFKSHINPAIYEHTAYQASQRPEFPLL